MLVITNSPQVREWLLAHPETRLRIAILVEPTDPMGCAWYLRRRWEGRISRTIRCVYAAEVGGGRVKPWAFKRHVKSTP